MVPFPRSALKLLAGILLASSAIAGEAEMAEGFARPPDSSRPWTFWFWVNGNVTKEGIKADLEDMKRVGIGGVMLFDGKMHLPGGPVRYGSDTWHEHVQYAIALADELGLQIGVMNCAGWATAGGPWNSLEQSMKMLVWSEQPVSGGTLWKGTLPQPPTRESFYRDVAVLAVPERDAPCQREDVTANSAVLVFEKPTACDTLILPATSQEGLCAGRLESSADGKTFTQVAVFEESSKDWPMPRAVKFPSTAARYFRLTFTRNPGGVKAAEARLGQNSWVPGLPGKIGVRVLTEESESAGPGIPATKVIDLSKLVRSDGSLEWAAPPGQWTILRFGYTTTAQTNHPAVPEGTGWEVDKFDAKAVAYHFEKGLGRLIKEAGPHVGRSLTFVVSDSWEAGPQTWTAAMPELFQERRGYPMGAYLACLAGRVIDTPARSEAFLRDYRRTLGDLYADSYYGTMARLAHEHGLKLMSEGYGGVLDEFKVNAKLDVPAVEFWNHHLYKSCGIVPSVAHTMGHPVVMAEAFTSRPPDQSGWRETPAMLKTLGDQAYALGINCFALHSYVHQPRSDLAPGFTHGRYGTQFGRLNSWWPLAGGWIDYLRRCQYLLQLGQPVIDLLYLRPEGLSTEARDLQFPWGGGRKGDYFSVDQLASATVRDGLIRVKSGLRYRALVLPERCRLSLAQLKELVRLRDEGGKILGAMEARPAGLKDLDQPEFPALAAAWKANAPVSFDFPADFLSDQPLEFFHRSGEGFDLYFVANPSTETLRAHGEFRVTGREPELWNPLNGHLATAEEYEVGAAITRVRLTLEPGGSIFVVFRRPATELRKIAQERKPESVVEVPGPWTVEFAAHRGAPKAITLPALQSLSKESDPAVRYFSGVATYRREIEAPTGTGSVRLDLGAVYDLAEVRVNGASAGILWKPPFVVDIRPLLRPGKNSLSVAVANRWINRLIGDEALPADAEYNEQEPNAGALKEFPAWWNVPGAADQRLRTSFGTWKHHQDREPLADAGLVGPVRLFVTP